MNTFYPAKLYILSLLFTSILSVTTIAQVGIGNTSPNANSLLEIGDGTDTKGVLLPRVALTGTNNPSPLATDVAGMIVYNTATNGAGTTAVTPGFYYNDGTDWVRLANTDDWKLTGNAGTIAGTNFIGTTDPQPLSFKTNNVERFWMSQNGQFRSTSDGTAAIPNFTWKDDTNTGFYSIGADILGFTTGGTEKFRLGTTEAVFNDISNDYDFRVETDNDAAAFFVNGGNDRIGIKTNNPQTDLHIAGASSVVRIESLNSTNDANNNGIDPSVVMVDSNGDLFLRPSVDNLPIDANDGGTGIEAFMSAPIAIGSADGTLAVALAYTVDITLTRTTLVEVTFWTGVKIEPFATGLTLDNKPRLFGGLVQTGTGTDIVYSANSYTNAASLGTITSGIFTVGGNGFITLPAGTHTIQLLIFTSGGEFTNAAPDAEGVLATFGANGFNRFQIVYHN